MINVFEFGSYKVFLKDVIAKSDERGFQGRLSRAARCEPSYLSRVLNGKAQLSPDQALSIAETLGLGRWAIQYFLVLVDLARASTTNMRNFLRQRLKELKELEKNTGRLTGLDSSSLAADLYYADWINSAIHILTAIDDFQTPDAIASRLNLPKPVVIERMKLLKSAGLLQFKANRWLQATSAVYAGQDSLNGLRHLINWRTRAFTECTKQQQDSGIRYTAVFSVGRSELNEISNDFRRNIANASRRIIASKDETAACINLDLFEI